MNEVTASCENCGALIAEADSFCIKCGGRRSHSLQATNSPCFCEKCGSTLDVGAQFCQKCGTPVSAATSSIAPDSATDVMRPGQVVSPPAIAAPSSPGSSKAMKFVMIAVVALMAFLILAMGSCAYIAYRAKRKAHAIEEAYKRNDVNQIAHELGINTSDHSSAPSPNQSVADSSTVAPAAPDAPAMPVTAPAVPVAASGDQQKDWALKYERTENGPEADLVIRTGDINNLGFGWAQGFDPFSGNFTPPHRFPWDPNPAEPEGTDRIMLGSAIDPTEALRDPSHYNTYGSDGYSRILSDCEMLSPSQTCKQRQDSWPQPVRLSVGKLPPKINAVLIQLFVDDFQAAVFHSHFQMSLNGTRIPTFEYSINSLNQTGPIGKLVSMKLLPEYWPLLESAEVKLLIDDPTTKVRDGYAIDFVRILINPHQFKYEVSLAASVIDADKHTPIPGASVTAALQSASTDARGKCQLSGLPAGLVTATGAAPGYDENSVPADLIAGQKGNVEIPLHRHDEGTAALERSIEQTGSATIYGIHFDTDSAKLRGDSLPALNAVLGLINNHPGSRWMISGHTDNQGNDARNQPLSERRAASVIAWLETHGVDSSRLDPKGFGASRPVADNSTPNGRALNRRVEIASAK